MTPERWHEITRIFDAACHHDPATRDTFVANACRDDPSLRQEVEGLLAAHDEAGAFGHKPLVVSRAESPSETSGSEVAPLSVGLPRVPLDSQSADIDAVLQRRLRAGVLISLGVNGVFNALRFARLDFDPLVIRYFMIPAAGYLGTLCVLVWILFRKAHYSRTQLRRIEGLFFGLTTVYFLGETYTPLFVTPDGGWLLSYVQRHVDEMSILARQPSIFWVVIIIGYGTFIPNTGRRCAVVTTTIALSALTVVGVAGLLHPAIPRRPLVLFLAEMTMWMGCAVAMAIYGSHKITTLHAQAFAARKLGQYQLKRRLGGGGMGEVYLAEHIMLKRLCAVKLIRADQTRDSKTLQRFLREMQATATLSHVNTIQVFDYGQTGDGIVFYAMEYLPGLNLEELVDRYGPLTPPRTVFVLRQLCGALAEAHAIGLIHRDIKPTNVILCSRGGIRDVAKLLDFGLVRLPAEASSADGLTQPGFVFGTPTYMSPEQAAGKTTVDARSDIYSLGALAYFLLTSAPPFVRGSVVETLAAHINDPVGSMRNSRPDIPEDLNGIVLRCLAKDPGDRFSAVANLEHALATCHLAEAWTQMDASSWWAQHTLLTSDSTPSL